ncbi:hypothetical protein D1B33_15005 [Lysinibacillus yapensis]|uniref:Uncharacterized protein n=1 Tax=Ureibacillus yapensis TaxID=2304605 RepID=A0A396S4M5_9BACL|nr:hypothetical protein [Lysinibacillus yapensis]RHW34099.1 hypothetical protein D1B33_15005 [Lysinibacillus yapensis]
MIGLLNLGSLVLGLMAWILPVINLMSYKKHEYKNWTILLVLSLSACAISLMFQIFYHYHLVKSEDWSALMDITGVVVLAAAVLLGFTIILNALTLIVYRNKTANY